MTEIVGSTTPELLVEASEGAALECAGAVSVIEYAPPDTSVLVDALTESMVVTTSSTDILVETTNTEIVADRTSETVYVLDPQTVLVDVGEQGPPGPPGAVGAVAKTLVYTGGVLAEVLSYSDAAKSMLTERRVLNYVGGVLTTVSFHDGVGALIKTRTLTYASGALSGYIDT